MEDVYDDMNIGSREAGFQVAFQKLAKYSVEGRRFLFRTTRPWLKPGQLLPINHPGYGLAGEEMLVEQVTVSTDGVYIYYDVAAVAGPEAGSWAKAFRDMAARGEALILWENIREEQFLITLAQFEKVWTEAESPNIFRQVRPGESLFPGSGTFPAFAFVDRVKYLAWFNGETELGRKPFSRQTGADTDKILTTTYLSPYEANETITHLGWVGGCRAAEDAGTGIIVDKQEYSKVKTEFEAIQVEKTDRRWA